MTSNEAWVVKIMLGGGVGVFALITATLTFLDTLQGDRQELVRAWFAARWQTIGQSGWLSLPETIIGALLSLEERFRQVDPLTEDPSRRMVLLWFGATITALVGIWISSDALNVIVFVVSSFPCLFLTLHAKGKQIWRRIRAKGRPRVGKTKGRTYTFHILVWRLLCVAPAVTRER
jgi:hypothetical protein